MYLSHVDAALFKSSPSSSCMSLRIFSTLFNTSFILWDTSFHLFLGTFLGVLGVFGKIV